jgi:hypothetical protein
MVFRIFILWIQIGYLFAKDSFHFVDWFQKNKNPKRLDDGLHVAADLVVGEVVVQWKPLNVITDNVITDNVINQFL